MHTVLNRPAFFNGEQIVFGKVVDKLCKSLGEIRREQQATIRWRKMNDYSVDIGDYNYVRIYDDALGGFHE